MISEGTDDCRGTLNPEKDPVAGIPDPAQMEVAPLATGDHGEHRAAFLTRPMDLDSLQQ